jgi:hypothetical protein
MGTQSVFGDHEKFKKKARNWALAFVFLFIGCFAVAPLGASMIWILSGTTAYCLFMSIYHYILSGQARYPYRKRKVTATDREQQSYIRFHLRMLLIILIGGVLLAMAAWLFFK